MDDTRAEKIIPVTVNGEFGGIYCGDCGGRYDVGDGLGASGFLSVECVCGTLIECMRRALFIEI